MSPSWLVRSFRKETGKAVHEFARDLRLERAKAHLMTTDKPISVISEESGFSDQSHLTRLFRKKYGATPLKLRMES